jgi:uncharacterized RDD family membrane protein YckC
MEEPIQPSFIFDQLEEEHRFVVYADPGIRFLNYIIDIALCYGLIFFIRTILPVILNRVGISGDDIYYLFHYNSFLWPFRIVLFFVYYFLFEGATKGRTPGKLITGTVAVTYDLKPITWRDALLRSLSRRVPFEAFTGFSARPWHDLWTKTRVIKKPVYL